MAVKSAYFEAAMLAEKLVVPLVVVMVRLLVDGKGVHLVYKLVGMMVENSVARRVCLKVAYLVVLTVL